MITLKEWMELVDYKITEGSTYGWNCYGPHAYTLDSWNGVQEGQSFSIIFDTQTQTVYEVQAHDMGNNRAYRIINPEFKAANTEESESRGVPKSEAWDNVAYIDLEVDEDFLEKAEAIKEGRDYDDRVRVPIDFTDEELLTYMKLAHERDITFNQLIEQALSHALAEFNQDPEGFKTRAQQFLNEGKAE